MKINHLKPGTRLMWDPEAFYPGTDKPIIYPALVLDKHHSRPWIRIATNTQHVSWIDPDTDYLRLPTQSELETLVWPEVPERFAYLKLIEP